MYIYSKNTNIGTEIVLNTMVGTGQSMIENNHTYQDVIIRVATKGGITEAGGSRDNIGFFPQGFDITLAKLFSIEEDDNIIVAD